MDSLRVKIAPDKGVKVKNRKEFIIWAASLLDLAQQAKNFELEGISTEVPDWSMVPLVIDHGLSLGYIRCGLTEIQAIRPITEDKTPPE